MTPTRYADLLVALVVAGLVVNLLMQVGYGSLPRFPLLAGLPLLAFAVAEALFGYSLRSRIYRRAGAEPVQPLTAARAVLLAKASAWAGALVTGAWLGVLGYVVPLRGQFPAAASDTWAGVVGVVCAAALAVAGLWLEHCCRTPDDRRSDER